MRKLLNFISICLMITMLFSIPTYAGQWEQDSIGWRYQDDNGTYKIGWYQDIDGKWYYFDEQSKYMLSDTITPDGYKVSETGEWIKGDENKIISYNGYENKVELEVSSYDSPYGAEPLGYTVPVTVYYNNNYANRYGGNIKIGNVAVSKDGLAYISFNVDKKEMYEIPIKCQYKLEDGTYIETDESLIMSVDDTDNSISHLLLERIRGLRRDSKRVKPVSVEIYVEVEEVVENQ